MRITSFLLFLCMAFGVAGAQEPSPIALTASGQINSVTQGSLGFHSPYAGSNSFPGAPQVASSRVLTLFLKFDLPGSTDLEVDVESAGGSGVGNALGLAAYTNLDVVRNPTLGSKPYLARALLHRSFFSRENRRLDVYAGQFSTVDLFDANAVGSDSHTQFLNWAIDNNAAYDYAADTRGYTRGVILQWVAAQWEFRAAEMMMPTVANGLVLSWSGNTRAENLEIERHFSVLHREASLTLLNFVNHAAMGSYRESLANTAAGAAPDVTLHRHAGAVKYGAGLNYQQKLAHGWQAFARLGWNEGHNESFAYTEANSTAAFGFDVRYAGNWKTGAAMATNGISADHKNYLAAGGTGFLLGDGRLTYVRESVVESYTTYSWRKGISASVDLQYIRNPGYNRDRGPVWVPALRLHWDLPSFHKARTAASQADHSLPVTHGAPSEGSELRIAKGWLPGA